MSTRAELDIRWPIGLLFLALGLVVAIYGLAAGETTGLPLGNGYVAEINLNVTWGAVMLLFGVFMTWGAHRAGKRQE